MAKKISVISLQALAEAADVSYLKLFHNLKGRYESLTHEEKTRLMNAFYDKANPIFNKLGFEIKVKRIKDQSPAEN